MNTNPNGSSEALSGEGNPQPPTVPNEKATIVPGTDTFVRRGIVGAVAVYAVLLVGHLIAGGDANGVFLLALFLAVWATVAVLVSKTRSQSSIVGVGGGFILGLLAIIPFAPSHNSHEESPKEARASDSSSPHLYVTKTGYFASPSREMFDKASSYLAAKDFDALQTVLQSGDVFRLKAGIEVHLVDTAVWSGMVKVRPHGQTLEFWTNTEAIEQSPR